MITIYYITSAPFLQVKKLWESRCKVLFYITYKILYTAHTTDTLYLEVEAMAKKTGKTMMIVLGSMGGAAAIGVAAVSLWNSRQMRMMRAVRRTNAIIHRIGNALCRISEATEECM